MLGGVGLCFINSPAKIAAVWFGKQEAGLRTAVITSMFPLGCMIGFYLPVLFIDSSVLRKFINIDIKEVVLTPDELQRG